MKIHLHEKKKDFTPFKIRASHGKWEYIDNESCNSDWNSWGSYTLIGRIDDFGIRLDLLVWSTARPRDTRILVPEKNRAAQNRASWGLYLCTKWDFFSKNSASSRLFFKIRASWGYTYVLKGILFSSPSIFWGVLNQNRPF